MEYDKYLFSEYNMFIVIRSCLMYSVMVIQSYIIYTDKIHKKLNNGLNQKVNEQDSQHLLQVS